MKKEPKQEKRETVVERLVREVAPTTNDVTGLVLKSWFVGAKGRNVRG